MPSPHIIGGPLLSLQCLAEVYYCLCLLLWSASSQSLNFNREELRIVGGGGGLVCKSVGKTDLLSDNFDSKWSWESVDLPLTFHPSSSHTTFVFRSSEVRHIFLVLDSYG